MLAAAGKLALFKLGQGDLHDVELGQHAKVGPRQRVAVQKLAAVALAGGGRCPGGGKRLSRASEEGADGPGGATPWVGRPAARHERAPRGALIRLLTQVLVNLLQLLVHVLAKLGAFGLVLQQGRVGVNA